MVQLPTIVMTYRSRLCAVPFSNAPAAASLTRCKHHVESFAPLASASSTTKKKTGTTYVHTHARDRSEEKSRAVGTMQTKRVFESGIVQTQRPEDAVGDTVLQKEGRSVCVSQEVR